MDDSNWDNFELRNFNHDLGRWSAPDPYGQFHSPYLAMANNPINNIDPNGGYILASDAGMSQRRQFMFDLDMDRMHQRGYFSFERLNKNYHDRLMELVAKRYAHGTTYFDDATHNDEGLLNAIMSLNNEYAGLGYPNELMSVGIDFVAAGSRNSAIFKSLIEFNGSASKAEAMAAVANNLQYSSDLLHSAELNWMSNNDARQRAYVNAWRNEKWEEQRKAAAEKKVMKEAREKLEEAAKKGEEYSNRDSHYARGKGGTLQDGQRGEKLKYGHVPYSTDNIVLTVFGPPGSINPMAGGSNFSNGNPNASSTIEGLGFLLPDEGSGITYDISYFDATGTLITSKTYSYGAQTLSVDGKNGEVNVRIPRSEQVRFGNLGGVIRIDIHLSNTSPGQYDACWNVRIDYWNQK